MCLPKKSYRWTASAAIVPSTRAIAVAARPTIAELASDVHMPSPSAASPTTDLVNPVEGNANVRLMS